MKNETKKKPMGKRVLFGLGVALKLLVLVGLSLSLVVYTNYTVDPGNVFSVIKENPIELQAAPLILAGNNVDGMGDNYNERLLKRSCVNNMTEPFDTIVMGSSRAAMLTSEMLGSDNMFNLFVTGATLEDMLGFYGLLYEKDLLPNTLVLVMDPWMLNDNYFNYRFSPALGDTYYRFVTQRLGYEADPALENSVGSWYLQSASENVPERVPLWDLDSQSLLNLIDIPYFQASLQRYFSGEWAVHDVTVTTDYYGTDGLLRSDGSYSYPEAYRDASAYVVLQRAYATLGTVTGFEDYYELEGTNLQMFQDFLRIAAQDGVEVQLLLEPLSPILYDYIKSESGRYEIFFEVEPLLYEIAENFGLFISGTFNPHTLGLEMDSFYDAYHVIPKALSELVLPFRE